MNLDFLSEIDVITK